MKVVRADDNALFVTFRVQPWPEQPFSAEVFVLFERRDIKTGQPVRRARIRYDAYPTDIQTARHWAQAILQACDIAERLEKEGSIILDGE